MYAVRHTVPIKGGLNCRGYLVLANTNIELNSSSTFKESRHMIVDRNQFTFDETKPLPYTVPQHKPCIEHGDRSFVARNKAPVYIDQHILVSRIINIPLSARVSSELHWGHGNAPTGVHAIYIAFVVAGKFARRVSHSSKMRNIGKVSK